MIPSRRARVFTIPASAPFLPTLIRALRDGALVPGFAPRDPVELARATIYLPTKRACRMAREAFLDALGVDAAVLPRIVPLGSIDEDEFAFAEGSNAGLDLPPAISGLERQALLTRLILAWAAAPDVRGTEGAALVATSPTAAFALAGELARLMDDMATRQVPWDRLDDLVPSDLDRYWQHTLEFLKIARNVWPAILKERGAIEPAERRDRLITAEAARLSASNDPVIAAGSTGSMPATASLIATIARLRHGAVVLPGLDLTLDERSWQAIDAGDQAPAAGHPQAAMHALLARMEVARGDVTSLTPPGARDVLISEALRPAATTDLWPARLADRAIAAQVADGAKDLVLIETANAEEEALAIAVALREAVEHDKRAALVTPDRRLARRVVAALARWQIEADDTAGEPLATTPAGVFARLAAETALGGLAPVPLLALLKHPLLRLNAEPHTMHVGIAALERAVLRGPRPRAGSAALTHALAATRTEWERMKAGEDSDIHASDPRALLTAPGFDAAADVVARLTDALAPLETIARGRPLAFRALAARHRDVLERLSADGDGVATMAGEDGAALAFAFDEIAAQHDDADLMIEAGDFTELFAATLAGRTVHRHGAPGASVRIYGLLEARLAETDRVILGGLSEGVWPPEVGTDPWLSRPMRQALGLNLPELRVGLTAHDFAQMFGAKEVILTRASKLAGAPTVASRFLQRLAAIAGERWKDAGERGEQYVAWARALDRPASVTPVKRPEPKPPIAARPTSFSVTEIENWLRDPYTIYAKRILRLRPLDPVDTTPGAAERGTAIHEALAEFTLNYAKRLPPDPLQDLLALGRKHFAPLDDYPEARAFWWPRFARIAAWFVGWEMRRRALVTEINAETDGRIEFPLGERRFTLRARADRIERLHHGGYAILDYKTGRVPGHDEVKVGLAPQLTLEAAILRNGGFPDIAAGASVGELVYVGLRGGDPGGEERSIVLKDSAPDIEADRALAELKRVALRFEDPETPYLSLVNPMWKRRYGDYDHLARIKEWSLAADDEEPL